MMGYQKRIGTVITLIVVLGLTLACGGGGGGSNNNTDNVGGSAPVVSPELNTMASADLVLQNSLDSGKPYEEALQDTVAHLKSQENISDVQANEAKSSIQITFTTGERMVYKTITPNSQLWQQVHHPRHEQDKRR